MATVALNFIVTVSRWQEFEVDENKFFECTGTKLENAESQDIENYILDKEIEVEYSEYDDLDYAVLVGHEIN